jgi:hypothetical protein
MSDVGRRNISIGRSKYLEEGGASGFRHIKYYTISNLEGQEFHVRGRLELAVAEKLNKQGRHWIRKIYLDYVDGEGKLRRYTPDFFLPEENLYIEAKGYFSDADQRKLDYVMEYNEIPCLVVVFQTWLDTMGL